ncbi:MAG: hypothetical protein EXQ70_07440 [Solirubrobacterales bacterium]|nr:hypothetical protein [Solirubrobacterales bacterium]
MADLNRRLVGVGSGFSGLFSEASGVLDSGDLAGLIGLPEANALSERFAAINADFAAQGYDVTEGEAAPAASGGRPGIGAPQPPG